MDILCYGTFWLMSIDAHTQSSCGFQSSPASTFQLCLVLLFDTHSCVRTVVWIRLIHMQHSCWLFRRMWCIMRLTPCIFTSSVYSCLDASVCYSVIQIDSTPPSWTHRWPPWLASRIIDPSPDCCFSVMNWTRFWLKLQCISFSCVQKNTQSISCFPVISMATRACSGVYDIQESQLFWGSNCR